MNDTYALGDEFSLAGWVGVLLVELENSLVLRSFDLVVPEFSNENLWRICSQFFLRKYRESKLT